MDWRSFSVLTLLCGMCTAADLIPVDAIDLIVNGDVERGDGRGGPKGWSRRRDLPASAALQWSTDRPFSGKRCLEIRSEYTGDRPWFWWEQAIPTMRGGHEYTVTGRVRTSGLTRGAVLLLSCHSDESRNLARKHAGGFPADTNGQWRPISFTFRTPAETTRGHVQFSMHGAGRVWLDAFAVRSELTASHLPFADSRVYPLTRAVQPVTIDGSASEWEDVVRAHVGAAHTVSQAEAIIMDKEDSKGSDDLSFEFSMVYDERRIYLLFAVRDDVWQTRQPYWQGDSIQLAFDGDYSRSPNGHDRADTAIGIGFREGRPVPVIERRAGPSGPRPEDVDAALVREEGGYRLELGVPWRALGMRAPGHNSRFGFTALVNDSDGSGRKWAEWTPGIARGKVPAQYGTVIVLSDGPIGVSLTAPSGRQSDLEPFYLTSHIVSVASSPQEHVLRLRIDDGGGGKGAARSVGLLPGVTVLPLAYEAGGVAAGVHRGVVEVAGALSSVRFELLALRATLAEVNGLLARVQRRMDALSGRVARARSLGLDASYADATLAVAECFSEWIRADAERPGHELLAQGEAQRLVSVLDGGISRIDGVFADPRRHPAVPVPDVMRAVLRGGDWVVDGRPVFLIGFNQFDPSHYSRLKRLGGNFDTCAGGAPAFLMPDGPAVDPDRLREACSDRVRAVAGHGIRANVHFGHRMPRWAAEKYADIADVEGHFMFYDIDHPAARELTCQTIEAVARELAGLPGVTSYDLWNEAAYSRMSARGRASFRAAMRRRYGAVEALNDAWGTQYEDFDSVRAVTRDPDQPAAYSDWVRWNTTRFTEYVSEMHAAVKRGDPDGLTTVKLSNEAVLVGSFNHAFRQQQTSRHNMGVDRYALAQLLDIHGCDTRPTLLSPDYAFAWRYPGMAYDLQRSLAPGKPIDDSEWHGIQTVYHEDRDQPGAFLSASLWFSYLHGVDMNLTWWWSRNGTEPRPRWFEGSLLTQPQLLDAWAHTSIQVQRFAPRITAFQNQSPRVRLLFSKPSAILDLHYLDTQRDTYERLSFCGVALGFVTEEMLLRGFGDCDLLIVPSARHVSGGVCEAMSALAEAGLSVIRIGSDCLTLTPQGTPLPKRHSLPGPVFDEIPATREWQAVLEQSGCAPGIRCTGPDGVSSRPAEFRSVTVGEETLGYLIGVGRQAGEVHLYHPDGRPVRWQSLLSGHAGTGRHAVEPYSVDLLVLR